MENRNSSSETEDNEPDPSTPELQGYLQKWTNYIHGWQTRFIVLKDSTLSYYKSAEDSNFGCRGTICLEKASIKPHEVDECRFDISVNNTVWYLRAENPEEKMYWLEVLQSFQTNPETMLKRYPSTLSIQSTMSTNSIASLSRTLNEKLHEIETYRDILFEQVATLQKYFDACSDISPEQIALFSADHGLNVANFKGDAITFRETSVGVLNLLQHCLEIIVQKDEGFKRKLDKEIEKRKKIEEQLGKCQEELSKNRKIQIGPDLEEGPNSTIPEDEFFDAVETGLDKIEEDRQIRVKLKLQTQQSQIESGQIPESISVEPDDFGTGKLANKHKLWPEIDHVCKEQLHHARQGVSEDGWQLFADEGEMKMYRREEEKDGMVIDPLKSCHVVKGCTAREMCHYFYDPQYRNDWETTLEDVQILEKISPDTLVFLQTHKRIWPASQRDALFWSHMRKVEDEDDFDKEAQDVWIVCNHSTESPDYPPANQGNCVRIYLTVILMCQTFVTPGKSLDELTRDDLTCRITYCSVVNPGGWAPATVLRAIYKKEYPKFLKRFTSYVLDQSRNKPIKF